MQKIFIQNGPLETKCPKLLLSYSPGYEVACEEGPGLFAHVLTFFSLVLILVTLPLSLLWVVKVVQEYERAVIFRLGRLIKGGARGPGVFFIIPCLDVYQKIDMRTATYDVPPQEVRQQTQNKYQAIVASPDPYERQRNRVRQRHHVLQSEGDLPSPSCAHSTALDMMPQDCVSAVANVDDYGGSARLLAATTLRNILGTKTLGDILSDRESIAR